MVNDGARRTAPDGVVGGREEEGAVGRPVLERIDGAGDVDVLCKDGSSSTLLL